MLNFQNTELAFKLRSDEELKSARFLFSSISNPRLVRFGSKWHYGPFAWDCPSTDSSEEPYFGNSVEGESIPILHSGR